MDLYVSYIHGNSSYVILYTQSLRYNICSAWFLDIRISTCFCILFVLYLIVIVHGCFCGSCILVCNVYS